MLRMMARRSEKWASFGKCSAMRMPGVLVSMPLMGPPLSVPGLGSKVSIWLGPPFIQSRMQARGGLADPCVAARARLPNHPDIVTAALAAPVRRNARRDGSNDMVGSGFV